MDDRGEKNWIVRAYERFYELPVPAVLVVLWLVGVVLLGSFALVLYIYVSALARVLL
jgi:hypothetical protein